MITDFGPEEQIPSVRFWKRNNLFLPKNCLQPVSNGTFCLNLIDNRQFSET